MPRGSTLYARKTLVPAFKVTEADQLVHWLVEVALLQPPPLNWNATLVTPKPPEAVPLIVNTAAVWLLAGAWMMRVGAGTVRVATELVAEPKALATRTV